MFLKQLTAIALLCVISTTIFAQESFDTLQRPLNRKVGVYKTYKDFLKNNPIISKPIKVIRINPEHKSINPKYNCVFDDSSSIDERVWGLFDGDKIYYRSGSSDFIPMHFAGKFSFHIYRDYSNLKIAAPVYTAEKKKTKAVKGTKVFDYAIKFYNDNGKLKKATSQAIGWLLRNDKDFTEEYNKEGEYNYAVFLKYLLKMNQRYPLD